VVPTYQTAGYRNPEDCSIELSTDNISIGYSVLFLRNISCTLKAFCLFMKGSGQLKLSFLAKFLKFYEPHCLRCQIYFILDMNVKRHRNVKTVGYYQVGDHISIQTETWWKFSPSLKMWRKLEGSRCRWMLCNGNTFRLRCGLQCRRVPAVFTVWAKCLVRESATFILIHP
jgi:hypothetical protein